MNWDRNILIGSNCPAAGGLSLGGPCLVEGTGFGWDEQIGFFAKLRDWRLIFWEPSNNGDFSKDGDFTIKDRKFINILLGCAPRHVAQLSKGLCHCCICIASYKSTAKDLTRTLTSPHHPHTQPKQRDQRNVQKACKLTRTSTSPHPDPYPQETWHVKKNLKVPA